VSERARKRERQALKLLMEDFQVRIIIIIIKHRIMPHTIRVLPLYNVTC
jgi:hypothetical protein